MQKNQELDSIRQFYDDDYYANTALNQEPSTRLSWHPRLIARRLGDLAGKSAIDIACGRGEWLSYLKDKKAGVTGVDLSATAIEYCKHHISDGVFISGPAESLPFAEESFDLVTCLGSLEHFVDKPAALREMIRVARPNAKFLILVPNSGFLTRRLGFYKGTNQAHIREDVLSLKQWEKLFEDAGLRVRHRWHDLHMLTWSWIRLGRTPLACVVRALQALILAFWPIGWQYQVYHYCERK